MKQLTLKQAKIQHRERQILAHAFELMADGGLEAVRLDTIAELAGCTRGTLYNHFRCREEMLVAMAFNANSQRLSLFELACSSAQSGRERLMAMNFAAIVYFDEMPLNFLIENAIRFEAIWNKTSTQRKAMFQENVKACMALASGCVKAGISAGDLPLPTGLTVGQMIERACFGTWSLVHGGLLLESANDDLDDVGIQSTRSTIQFNCNALLDAYQWQPLYDPLNYRALQEKLSPILRSKAREMLAETEKWLEPFSPSKKG